MKDQQSESWHLDRRIPIATIWVMVIQLVGGVWFAAQLYSEVSNLTQGAIVRDRRITTVEAIINSQAVSNATLSADLRAVRGILDDLKLSQKETNELLREMRQSQ